MGALTEYVDMMISKEAYRIASAITDNLIDYFELGAENVTEDEICSWIKETYPDDGFMIRNADLIAGEAYAKLQQLIGKSEPQKFFLLSEWHFRKNKDASQKIIRRCCRYGLDWEWRMSKETDFFVFRPKRPGIGLEIKNVPNYTPDRLTQIFYGIQTDSGPMIFRW